MKLSHWVVQCGNGLVYGPFKTETDAAKYAREVLNSLSFKIAPVWRPLRGLKKR